MNYIELDKAIAKLYKELPKLETINVEKTLWFDRDKTCQDHANTRIGVCLFDRAGEIRGHFHLSAKATTKEIADAIRKEYKTEFV
jgi:hypothetical protein